MIPIPKKIVASILLVLAIVLLHLPATRDLATHNAWFAQLDEQADAYLDSGLKRAAWAFAAARTANAVISVLQSFVIQGSAGIIVDAGVEISPGEALDPVNDLVERFSWVMLASVTSLGVQQFLLEVMPWFAIRGLLSLALGCGLLALWLPGRFQARLAPFACKMAVAALALRLLIPLAAIADQYVYDTFLAPKYEIAAGEVTRLNQGMQQDDGKDLLDRATEMKELLTHLAERTTDYARHLLTLIIVFVIQAALLPLATLYFMIQLLKWLAGITGELTFTPPSPERTATP